MQLCKDSRPALICAPHAQFQISLAPPCSTASPTHSDDPPPQAGIIVPAWMEKSWSWSWAKRCCTICLTSFHRTTPSVCYLCSSTYPLCKAAGCKGWSLQRACSESTNKTADVLAVVQFLLPLQAWENYLKPSRNSSILRTWLVVIKHKPAATLGRIPLIYSADSSKTLSGSAYSIRLQGSYLPNY